MFRALMTYPEIQGNNFDLGVLLPSPVICVSSLLPSASTTLQDPTVVGVKMSAMTL